MLTQLLPIRDGGGVAQATARAPRPAEPERGSLLAQDYEEVEYLLAGSARTYSGPATGPASASGKPRHYATRVLVRYPRLPSVFSGRVVIEPFNTSAGHDRDIVWAHVGSLLQEQGDAWIGVTTRASSVSLLQQFDPTRYSDLHLPSNDVGWDVLGQLGRLVKNGGHDSPLGHLAARRCYLGGYSQSGCDVATFAMAFSHGTRMDDASAVYDGYFPAAHAASLTPIATGTDWMPVFECAPPGRADRPVVQIETQSDVEGFAAELGPDLIFTNPGGATVRRDDSDLPDDRYRLYEIAGAPHHSPLEGCDGPRSTFPISAFVRAALANLFRWVEHDAAPPIAPRIAIANIDVVSSADVDLYGNTLGGVRSPFLDVPVARYEAHSTPGPLAQLAGRETALPPEVLASRHCSAQAYLAEFADSLDSTIAAGFLLKADRTAILRAETAKAHAIFSSLQQHQTAAGYGEGTITTGQTAVEIL
jgi:Alpha/beta hydrolase domain